MNYCSLEDAWGSKCNQISDQYKNYMNENNFNSNSVSGSGSPNSSNDVNAYGQNSTNGMNVHCPNQNSNFRNTIEHFHNVNTDTQIPTVPSLYNSTNQSNMINTQQLAYSNYGCDPFIAHISQCDKCRNRISNLYRPKLVENFQNIINDNKDTIVIVLLGIAILLFFNLLMNVGK